MLRGLALSAAAANARPGTAWQDLYTTPSKHEAALSSPHPWAFSAASTHVHQRKNSPSFWPGAAAEKAVRAAFGKKCAATWVIPGSGRMASTSTPTAQSADNATA